MREDERKDEKVESNEGISSLFDSFKSRRLGDGINWGRCVSWLERNSVWVLIGIILISLTARLMMLVPGMSDPRTFWCRTDTPTYVGCALSLSKNLTYKESPDSDQPASVRPPGMPVILAICFFLFGDQLYCPAVLLCTVSALTCWPIYLGGKCFGGSVCGLLAAAFWGMNITSVAMAPLILSDTLFAFVVAWQFCFFLSYAVRPRLLYVLLALACAAIATLVRPINLLWILPAVFLIMIHGELVLRKKLIHAALAICVFACVIGPWAARNAWIDVGWRVDSNIGDTLLYHNCAVLMSKVTGKAPSFFQQKFAEESEAEFRINPEKYRTIDDKLEFMTDKAMEMIKKHPWLYLRLHLQPQVLLPGVHTFFELLGLTQTGRGTLDVLHQKGVFAAVKHYFEGKLWLLLLVVPALIVVCIMYCGCVAQLFVWLWTGKWFYCFLFLAFVEYYLFLPGPITMPRYHLPALPMMSVMAGLFIVNFYYYLKRQQNTEQL